MVRSEKYRIVIENGRVRINVFDRGNPQPVYSTHVKLNDNKGKEIVALFLQKYGVGLKEYKQICENYDKTIKEDMEAFVKNNGA